MVWTKEKDLVLLQEVAAEGVMHQKPKSRDRGSAWWLIVSIHFQAMRSAPDQSGIDITTWQKNIKLRWDKKKGQLVGEAVS